MTAATPPLTAAPLWARARAMFARALAAIGDIAARKTLTPDVRRQIIAWLAPLEHVVRKLLLAEAAKLHGAESRRHFEVAQVLSPPRQRSQAHRTPPSRGRGRKPTPRQIDPAHPETWSANFSLSPPRDPLAIPDSRAPRTRALWGETPPALPPPSRTQRAVSAEEAPFRLARRLEAIRRVLENPLPHAQRLAQLLARAVRRFPEIVQRYLFMPARTGDYDEADPRLSIDALREAFDAPELITDSS